MDYITVREPNPLYGQPMKPGDPDYPASYGNHVIYQDKWESYTSDGSPYVVIGPQNYIGSNGAYWDNPNLSAQMRYQEQMEFLKAPYVTASYEIYFERAAGRRFALEGSTFGDMETNPVYEQYHQTAYEISYPTKKGIVKISAPTMTSFKATIPPVHEKKYTHIEIESDLDNFVAEIHMQFRGQGEGKGEASYYYKRPQYWYIAVPDPKYIRTEEIVREIPSPSNPFMSYHQVLVKFRSVEMEISEDGEILYNTPLDSCAFPAVSNGIDTYYGYGKIFETNPKLKEDSVQLLAEWLEFMVGKDMERYTADPAFTPVWYPGKYKCEFNVAAAYAPMILGFTVGSPRLNFESNLTDPVLNTEHSSVGVVSAVRVAAW